MLQEPARTAYDLNFRVGDVPVRVHPLFWLVTLLLGARADTPPVDVVIWMIAVFISILIHELGHVAAFRYYNEWAYVVLYSFGGLAVPDGSRGGRRRFRSGWPQIIVSFAGPAAGFLFAAALVGGLLLTGKRVMPVFGFPFVVLFVFEQFASPPINTLIFDLFFINILWGLVNLLPIWPLDGGRISQELFVMVNPRMGVQRSAMLSIGVAAGMAAWGAASGSLYTAVMFGYLAYLSYQVYQAANHGYGRPW